VRPRHPTLSPTPSRHHYTNHANNKFTTRDCACTRAPRIFEICVRAPPPYKEPPRALLCLTLTCLESLPHHPPSVLCLQSEKRIMARINDLEELVRPTQTAVNYVPRQRRQSAVAAADEVDSAIEEMFPG
jgi:hypothetical protein